MTKRFQFRRHSIKDGPTSAMIGPTGYALARAVGAEQLRGQRFDSFYTSTFFRTQQTFAAFAEGANDFRLKFAPPVPPIYLDNEELWKMWDTCAAAEKRGEDMMRAAWQHDSMLTQITSDQVARLFIAWSSSCADHTNALIVGHSPHMEFLLYGLFRVMIPGLKECQGFRITIDGRTISYDNSSSFDPSRIREELFHWQTPY